MSHSAVHSSPVISAQCLPLFCVHTETRAKCVCVCVCLFCSDTRAGYSPRAAAVMLDEKKTKTAVVVGFLSIFSAYYESRENTHTRTQLWRS